MFLALLVALAGEARGAAGSTQRHVMVVVEGSKADELRQLVAASLGENLGLADDLAVQEALREQGLRSVGPRPSSETDRTALLNVLRGLADKVRAEAVAVVHTSSGKTAHRTWVLVLDARTGEVLTDQVEKSSTRKKSKRKTSTTWALEAVAKALDGAVARLAALPSDRGDIPAPVTKPASDQSSTNAFLAALGRGDDEAGDGRLATSRTAGRLRGAREAASPRMASTLLVKAGVELGSRSFSYAAGLTATPRSYSVVMAPLAAAELQAFPFNGASTPVLRNLGLTGSFAQAFALESRFKDPADSSAVRNTWRQWQAGLAGRFSASPDLGLVLSAQLGHLEYAFAFAADDDRAEEIPNVSYGYVRGGADLRYGVTDKLELVVGGAYLHVLDGGRVAGAEFPRAAIAGAEALGGASLNIMAGLSAEVGVRYTRFFYDTQAKAASPLAAGGSSDAFLYGSLGLAYALGGP